MKHYMGLLAAGLMAISAARAGIVEETVIYEHAGTPCEGTLVMDDTASGPRPGIVIFHQWSGPSDYERKRASMLAELGYVVFVADIYSKDVRPQTLEERQVLVGAYRADRAMTRARARAALDVLTARPEVEPSRIGAIGYCFGGMVALELARSGAPLAATVSIHGSLNTPNPADAANIKGKVLVQHGAIDPYVPAEEVASFRKEMADANVNTRVIEYENAVHSFTDWNAGDDPSTGAAYNEEADRKSWNDLIEFLHFTAQAE